MAFLRVNRDPHHKIPAADDVFYADKSQIVVFRGEQVKNIVGKRLGPYIVQPIAGATTFPSFREIANPCLRSRTLPRRAISNSQLPKDQNSRDLPVQ